MILRRLCTEVSYGSNNAGGGRVAPDAAHSAYAKGQFIRSRTATLLPGRT